MVRRRRIRPGSPHRNRPRPAFRPDTSRTFPRGLNMKWNFFLPASAGVLLLTAVGCTSPLTQLIRGQSPDNACPSAAPNSGAIVYGDGCQEVQSGSKWGWGSGCRIGNGWHRSGPTPNEYESQRHTHYWDYIPPYGLTYPPDGQPNAVVFYPYYTLKGPDDFFYGMKNR
jgi:hypothetical protein